MSTPLSDAQLAAITADVKLAASGPMVGVPRGAQRYEAWVRIGDQHGATLLAEIERLRAELGRHAPRPSRFNSTPLQIETFLGHYFAEDQIQRYQWAIGNRAAEHAARDIRSDANLRQLEGEHRLAEYGRELAALIDPLKGGGHYPDGYVRLAPKEN